ncbi:hypothetical protein [[Clostridium] colinum]|uniref:hypothetical protein n=1 Tax=[Clostridium] colinum TaxID=36835 RepID=UPI002024B6BA|nr:hypothetical protein [[Clostridium] colinum]
MKNKERLIDEIYEEILKKIQNINQSLINKHRNKIIVFGNQSSFFNKNFEVVKFNDLVNTDEINAIYITFLSLTMLSSLANLLPISKEEEFILEFLAKGKNIYIFKNGIEYKKYINTLPKEVYKKYLSFENILKSYNIKFINEVKEDVIKNERLICLNNIKNHIKGNKLILNNDKIISPLAKDFIKENNIILERR